MRVNTLYIDHSTTKIVDTIFIYNYTNLQAFCCFFVTSFEMVVF